jgi:hypothetical protein
MLLARSIAAFAIAFASPVMAQEAEPAAEPEFNCDQKDLPAEIAQLCLGLGDGYRDAMSRPVEISGPGRPVLGSSSAFRPLIPEVTGRGLAPTAIDRSRSPFDGPEDRGVGVLVRGADTPVQLSTEMVQPGSSADTDLNWELKAEHASENSDLFFGGTTGGTFNPAGASENISGFAGLRSVMKPADNTQFGAEIAPRIGVSDFNAPQGSFAIEPKFTAKSDLGRLGTSDFVGSVSADAAYSLPIQGDPSAWGGFRFTVKPQ